MTGKIEIDQELVKNAEKNRNFDLTGEIEINEKSRQNAENEQT